MTSGERPSGYPGILSGGRSFWGCAFGATVGCCTAAAAGGSAGTAAGGRGAIDAPAGAAGCSVPRMKANATMARPNTAAAPRIRPGDLREAGGGVGGVWGAFLDCLDIARSILLRRDLDATATISRKGGRRVDCPDVRQGPGLSGMGRRLRHLGNRSEEHTS